MRLPRSLAIVLPALLAFSPVALGLDCDQDGVDDAEQIAANPALDCNQNGLLDACDLSEPRPQLGPPSIMRFEGSGGRLELLDLDGDGGRDLLVDTQDPEGILVLRGVGDGTFELVGYARDTDPDDNWRRRDLTVADFDGDGDADVAVISSTSREIRVLIQTAPGEFEIGSRFDARAGFPLLITTANIDGQGGVDLVVAGDSDVVAFSGAGDGSFTFLSRVTTGNSGSIYDLTAADLDDDGDDDVAVVYPSDDRVVVYESRAGGVLAEAGDIRGTRTLMVAAGDVDGDGVAELLTAPQGIDTLVLVHELGVDGQFSSGRAVGELPLESTFDVVVIDLDDDGVVELVGTTFIGSCAHPNGSIWILRGFGAGEFPAHPRVYPLAPASTHATGLAELAVADFDGDELSDVATFQGGVPTLKIQLTRRGPDSADCNGDTVPDECQLAANDCDADGVPDDCQLETNDANGNGLPDTCDPDCDGDGVADHVELTAGAADCNENGIPDECELATHDRDGSGVLDECELLAAPELDCNENGVPDSADLRSRLQFRTPFELAFGEPVDGAALIDLGDRGHLGLVVASGGGCCPDTGSIVELYSFDRGAFTPLGEVARLAAPGPLQVADLDGDGLDDLVAVDRDDYCRSVGAIRVLPGVGPAVFGAEIEYPLAEPAVDIEVADFDLDGSPDIALVTGSWQDPGALRVLSGGAGFEVISDVPLARGATALSVADVDDDGAPDVAVALHVDWEEEDPAGKVVVFTNDRAAGFDASTTIDTPSWVTDVVLTDLDDDGHVDLAFDGQSEDDQETSALAIWRGAGDGKFGPAATIVHETYPGHLIAADLDADGRTDLAIAAGWTADPDTEPNTVVASVYLRAEGWEYGSPRHWLVGGETPRVAFAHDFDRDDLPELVIGTAYLGRLSVIPNRGAGLLDAPRVAAARSVHGLRSLVAGDLDRDGRDELIGATWGEMALRVLERRSNGELVDVATVAIPGFAGDLVLARVDGDANPDVLVINATALFLLPGRGDISFDPPQLLAEKEGLGFVATGDIDADGDTDLVVATGEEVMLLEGDGTGSFTPPVVIGEQAGWLGGLALADVDADGRDDIAVVRSSERALLHVHLGADLAASPLELDVGLWTADLTSGDVDGDGDSEILVSTWDDWETQRGPQIVDLDGDALAVVEELHVPFSWRMTLVDLDANGRSDLVAAGPDHVWLVEQSADVGFLPAVPIGAASSLATLTTGDLDGDGDPDVVYSGDVAEGGDATVTILNDSGPRSFDVDGDGAPDECLDGLEFTRGDLDASGSRNVTDAIALLLHLFEAGAAPPCAKAADVNDDGVLNITDPIALLEYLFAAGRPLPAPLDCGADPTADDLGCEAFPICPPDG